MNDEHDHHSGNGIRIPDTWPDPPEYTPDVMTELETCQFLRLDDCFKTPLGAIRRLRDLRKEHGLPGYNVGGPGGGISPTAPAGRRGGLGLAERLRDAMQEALKP